MVDTNTPKFLNPVAWLVGAALLVAAAVYGLGEARSATPTYTPVVASDPATCDTLESLTAQAAGLGVKTEDFVVVRDIGFISDYLKAVGLGIPEDSEPQALILAKLNGRVFLGIIEPNGCSVYKTGIDITVHEAAIKRVGAGL